MWAWLNGVKRLFANQDSGSSTSIAWSNAEPRASDGPASRPKAGWQGEMQGCTEYSPRPLN